MTEPHGRLPDAIARILGEATPAERIRYVPQGISKGDGDRTALAVPYIDARYVMERLDLACGPFGWQSEVKDIAGVLCVGIGIFDVGAGRWVWKWDTGQENEAAAPDGEGEEDSAGGIGGAKALMSGGLKRAAAQWNIGRDVYMLPKHRHPIKVNAKGKFDGWLRDVTAGTAVANGRGNDNRVSDSVRFADVARAKHLTQEERGRIIAEAGTVDGRTDWRRAIEIVEKHA